MSGIFEAAKKNTRCPSCAQVHSGLTLCKHEDLLGMVQFQRKHLRGLVEANRAAIDTAKDFQKIIRDIEPRLARMSEFILKLNDMNSEPKDKAKEREEILLSLGYKKVDNNFEAGAPGGTTKLPAEAPKQP